MIGACRNGQPFSDWMRTPLFALSQIRQAPGLFSIAASRQSSRERPRHIFNLGALSVALVQEASHLIERHTGKRSAGADTRLTRERGMQRPSGLGRDCAPPAVTLIPLISFPRASP